MQVRAGVPGYRATLRIAQHLHEDVPNVLVRRGKAPGVVRRAPDQDIMRQSRDGGALSLPLGRLEMHLHHDLGIVVAELRTLDRERISGLRGLRCHHQPVRCLATRWLTRSIDEDVAGKTGRRTRLWVSRVQRDDGPLVDRDGAGDVASGQGAVREDVVDGGGCLRVFRAHEVFPDSAAPISSESILELGEKLRVPRFTTPTSPEDRPDERGHGDDVVHRSGLDRDLGVGLEVGVEAIGVRLRVRDDLLAFGKRRADPFHLVGDQLLDGRTRFVGRGTRDQAEGIDAGDVGDRGSRGPSTKLDEQFAISHGDPTGTERDVFPRRAGDVCHAVLVIDESEPRAAGIDDGGFANRLEVLLEEELLDVLIGHVPAQRRQAVVERKLVEGVLFDRKATVVARRQDVIGAIIARATTGRRGRARFRNHRRRRGRLATATAPVGFSIAAPGEDEKASKCCGECAFERFQGHGWGSLSWRRDLKRMTAKEQRGDPGAQRTPGSRGDRSFRNPHSLWRPPRCAAKPWVSGDQERSARIFIMVCAVSWPEFWF